MGSDLIKPHTSLRSTFIVYWLAWCVFTIPQLAMLLNLTPDVGIGASIIGLGMSGVILVWLLVLYSSLEYCLDERGIESKKTDVIFWKSQTTIPYSKITNINIVRGPIQRLFGIGSLHVQTAGTGQAKPELKMLGIPTNELDALKKRILDRIPQ